MFKKKQVNPNFLNIILLIIGLGLILNLFSKGIYTTCQSGWIGCIIPTPHYKWIIPGYLALFVGTISLILYVFKKNKLINKDRNLGIYILVLGIVAQIINVLLSTEFKIYVTGMAYKDKQGIVSDVNKYFEVLEDKCLNGKNKVNEICNGSIIEKFQNIDDYIKVLEYTKKNNLNNIYETTYKNLFYVPNESFYNEQTIKEFLMKYHNKTIELKLLIDYLYYNNLTAVNLLKNYSSDEDIKDLAKFYIDKYNDLENKKNSINIDEYKNSLNSIIQELEFKARKINGVEHDMIKYTQPTIESFIRELNNAFSSNNYSVCYDIIREANALHEPGSISYSVVNETFTIKELIREYKDKTFQVALILNTFNLNYFNLLKENAVDEDISKIANDSIKIISDNSINNIHEKWEKYKEYLDSIDTQNIKGINDDFFISENN